MFHYLGHKVTESLNNKDDIKRERRVLDYHISVSVVICWLRDLHAVQIRTK